MFFQNFLKVRFRHKRIDIRFDYQNSWQLNEPVRGGERQN